MVRTIAIIFCLGVIVAVPVAAQDWVFSDVQRLPATVNSPAEESMPLLSRDGRTLYFARMMFDGNTGGRFAGQDTWVSTFNGSSWTQAVNRFPAFRNNRNHNAIVGMSADENTLYFLDASPYQRLKGIYFTKNINGKWTSPELIPIEGLSHEGFVGFYVSPDFDVILISMKREDSRGEEDLYVCLKDASGKWSAPRNLGPSINTTGFEISPFLSPDKKRLYFSSNGHAGLGEGDLFLAERLYDSWETWSAPKNLGKEINTEHFEGYLYNFRDSLVYFTSNRGGGLAEVYSARVSRRDILAGPDRQLLSRAEVDKIFGANARTRFEFEKENVLLSLPQEEMIYYIIQKMESNPDLSIRIVVREESREDLTKARVQAIYAFIVSSGLIGSRVQIEQSPNPVKNKQKTIVELAFLRGVTN